MNYTKWLNHEFSTGPFAGKDYLDFQKEMRVDLKKIAAANGFVLHKFNKNHYEFSAVLKDRERDVFVYINIADVRFFKNQWYDRVLYRTMKHDTDWSGGRNNFTNWENIGREARALVNHGR